MFCYSVRIDTNTLFEIASTSLRSLILERNHVVVLPILFSCQGADVRERAARVPDPHVRVKRIGFMLMKPIRLTRTRLPLSNAAGKICGLELPSPLAGTGECTSPPPRCQLLRKFRYQLTAAVDYSGSRDRPQPGRPHCYSSLALAAQPAVQIRVTACFPKIPYRSGTSRNDPTPGPIPPISVPRRHSGN